MELHKPLVLKDFENFEELTQISQGVDAEKKAENIELTLDEIVAMQSILNAQEI